MFSVQKMPFVPCHIRGCDKVMCKGFMDPESQWAANAPTPVEINTYRSTNPPETVQGE